MKGVVGEGYGCPEHPNIEPEVGYGLAGGGMGVYSYCPVCGMVIEKVQDPEYGDHNEEQGDA